MTTPLHQVIAKLSGSFELKASNLLSSENVIALSTSLWIMNILMQKNFMMGLTLKDQSLFNHAKELLVTEMKRVDYNLNDYEIIHVSKPNAPFLLQIKFFAKKNESIDQVNKNLEKLIKIPSMDLNFLYAQLSREDTGISLLIANCGHSRVSTVIEILKSMTHEIKLSSLQDILDLYGDPKPAACNNAITISADLINPWTPAAKLSGLYISAPIFNQYNKPFMLLSLIEHLIFLLEQKVTSDKNILMSEANLLYFRNKIFGQRFQFFL